MNNDFPSLFILSVARGATQCVDVDGIVTQRRTKSSAISSFSAAADYSRNIDTVDLIKYVCIL